MYDINAANEIMGMVYTFGWIGMLVIGVVLLWSCRPWN
jgi:hypothetical protein